MTRFKMSHSIRLVAICAFAGAAAFAAAQLVLAPRQPSTAAVTTTVSPLEMMIRNDDLLPVDFWDAS
jgi:hypothetical protein